MRLWATNPLLSFQHVTDGLHKEDQGYKIHDKGKLDILSNCDKLPWLDTLL